MSTLVTVTATIFIIVGTICLNSCNAKPLSVLDVIFGGRAVPETKHLIYPRTPVKWMLLARQYGKIARQNLTNAFDNKELTEPERFQLYGEYLNKCSGADQQFMDGGEDMSTSDVELTDGKKLVKQFALGIGFDEMTATLFALPAQLRRLQIGSTCARNELRLQCALGFYNNRMAKLREHIGMLKEDGIFKVMLETECPLAADELSEEQPEEEQQPTEATDGLDGIFEAANNKDNDNDNGIEPMNSVFQCVHKRAAQLTTSCAIPLTAYKMNRQQTNERIQTTFEAAIAALDRRLERAADSGEQLQVQRALRNGEAFLKRAMNQLARMESTKCRSFTQMLQCLLANVQRECGQMAASSLETMLKLGYLRRERGDVLHAQFSELAVGTSDQCAETIDVGEE